MTSLRHVLGTESTMIASVIDSVRSPRVLRRLPIVRIGECGVLAPHSVIGLLVRPACQNDCCGCSGDVPVVHGLPPAETSDSATGVRTRHRIGSGCSPGRGHSHNQIKELLKSTLSNASPE